MGNSRHIEGGMGTGAKDVLNDFNKKWPRKYKPGPNYKSKRKRPDE